MKVITAAGVKPTVEVKWQRDNFWIYGAIATLTGKHFQQPNTVLLIDICLRCQASISDDDYIEGAPELVAKVAASSASNDLHDISIDLTRFEKITTNTTVDLDEFLQQLEELDPDPNQSALQEISQIVKEVLRKFWSDQ